MPCCRAPRLPSDGHVLSDQFVTGRMLIPSCAEFVFSASMNRIVLNGRSLLIVSAINIDPPGAVRDGGAVMWMFDTGGVALRLFVGVSPGLAGGCRVIVRAAGLVPFWTLTGSTRQLPLD